TQGGGSTSAATAPWPGQLHSPRLSIHTWVREALLAMGIQVIERQHRAEPNPCTKPPSKSPRPSARAPNVPRVAEAERALGGFGEVEFAAGHIRSAVDNRHAYACLRGSSSRGPRAPAAPPPVPGVLCDLPAGRPRWWPLGRRGRSAGMCPPSAWCAW